MTLVVLPDNVTYGFVTGHFSVDGPGGADIAGKGKVRFMPNPRRLRDLASDPPTTIELDPLLYGLDDDGDLVDEFGTKGVSLIATDNPLLDPVDWTWGVTISLEGQAVIRFNMLLPAGTTVDLANVVPAEPSSGTVPTVITGPAGPPGPPGPAGPLIEDPPGSELYIGYLGSGGGGSVSDVVWVGTSEPADTAMELWWDTDEPSPVRFDVSSYGVIGDNTVDCTTGIQAAIDAAWAAGGGTVVFPAGLFRITDTLVMKTNVSLHGEWPTYNSSTPLEKGTWLVWAGSGTKTMVQIGHKDQTTDVHSVNIDQIGFDGQSDANVTGWSFGSNTRTSAVYITTRINVRRCIVAKLGIGVQWGTGETQEQTDFIYIQQTDFIHCAVAGVRVNATNGGDLSTFDTCTFIDCSAAGDPYIDLLLAGAITFRNCAGGGDGTNTKGFLRRSGTCNKITLVNCQSEKMRYFLRTEGATDYQNPVMLQSCWLDDGVEIAGGQIVVSTNTKIRDLVQMSGTGGRWHGFGDTIVPSQGGRVVDSGTSNVFYNLRFYPASIYTVYAAGEEIPMAAPALMSSPNRQYVVRSGRNAPLWTATTAYTGIAEPSWKPSTAYSVGDYITPTYGNTRKYQCTTAGTSGATEPNFKLYGTTPTDGTCAWAASVATTTPTYVLPKVDNAHVYKLVTAGTSSGTEPTWPLTAGTTVTDGTCVWQETGPATLIRQTSALAQDAGNAIPTSGYYERGSIRWNNGMDPGEQPAWMCTASGNPGTWSAWAPMPRILTRTATPITHAVTDLVLLSNMSVAGAVTVNLTSAPIAGQIYTIKDAKGDAAANNVTVVPASGTIDGAANKVINTNYGSIQLVHTGSTWCVV